MISIVIPAYNEEKTIGRCIESLIDQTTDKPYEVIVVDNGSADRTFETANKYKDKLDLKVIKEPVKGRGSARFAGFRKAKGEIILSLDGDSIAPRDWIEKLTAPLSDKNIVAVTGTGRIEDCSRWTNICFDIIQPTAMVAYRLFAGHFWLTGFNFAIRSDDYKKAGEFNPALLSNEDIDLANRVNKLGKIKFIRFPVIVDGRRVKNGFLKGMLSYLPGYINQFAFKKPQDLSDIR